MGGFKVSMTQRELKSMWRHEKLVFETRNKFKEVDVVEGVLTRRCFEALLSKNRIAFPTISEDEINDRSKGDALSKGIAYLQLAWFIVQIITRAVQGLAITELELTTAALVGLNSAMYLFWWSIRLMSDVLSFSRQRESKSYWKIVRRTLSGNLANRSSVFVDIYGVLY